MSKVRIKIKDVIDSGVNYAYMLLLQTFDEKTVFPIFISNKDADSFVEVMKNINFKRPQTHALLMDFFEKFDVKIREVYIHKLQEGIFYSTIYCSQDAIPYEFDARPSDSLILALKCGAPIFINSDILDNIGRSTQEVMEELSEENEGGVMEDDHDFKENDSLSEPNIEVLSTEELEELLQDSVSVEDFETASKIRDIILMRKKQKDNISKEE